MTLQAGDVAPDVTLLDQDGSEWTLSARRGRPVVLYFYPKDDTPGCTTQGCEIRDSWASFAEAGAAVAGISPDSAASHAKFAGKYGFPHTLLADPERTVIQAYGAWGERSMYGKTYMGVVRSSVVIAPDGTVAAVFSPIKPGEQSRKALEAIASLA